MKRKFYLWWELSFWAGGARRGFEHGTNGASVQMHLMPMEPEFYNAHELIPSWWLAL